MSEDQSNQFSRRAFASSLGTVVLASSATIASAAAAPDHTMMAMGDMKACILECQKCSATCTSLLIETCLKAGGRHTAPDHVRIMLDCAQICATTADLMARGSAFHAQMCGLCADVCEACARSCDGLAGMAACIAACRSCAKSCRAMAAMG